MCARIFLILLSFFCYQCLQLLPVYSFLCFFFFCVFLLCFCFICLLVDLCAGARTILKPHVESFEYTFATWMNLPIPIADGVPCEEGKFDSPYNASKPKIFPLFHSFVAFECVLVSVWTFVQPNEFAHSTARHSAHEHIDLQQIYSTLTLTDLCEKVSLVPCLELRVVGCERAHLRNERNVYSLILILFASFARCAKYC